MTNTIADLCKELQKSQTESLERFKVKMQQKMAHQMAIITELQCQLTKSVQTIVNTSITQIQVAEVNPAMIRAPQPQH
eukprot:4174796-Ditylum_brightwellii.AAC.1